MELSPQDTARFWAKVRKLPGSDGCWLWTAGTWSSGEPVFYLDHHFYSARRIAYFLRYGEPHPGKALSTFPPCFMKRCLAHLTRPDPATVLLPMRHFSPKDLARFWGYIEQPDGPTTCWIWHGPTEKGRYPIFQAQRTKWTPARLLHVLTHGPIPPGIHVIHDPACLNHFCVRHTILSTKKSTHLRVNASHTKLTREQVIAMRQDHATHTYTLKALAEKYHLRSLGEVSEIVNRRAFATIP